MTPEPRSASARHGTHHEPLFVYGTLRRGGAYHHLLTGSRFLRSAAIEGRLHDTGEFPALVQGSGSFVRGEIWGCTPETLARLDSYEGVAEGLFVRERLRVEGQDVWVYVAGPALIPELAKHPIVRTDRWPEAISDGPP